MKYLILLAFIPTLVFGQVKYLKEGEIAPYTGYLFTPEEEKRVYDNEIELNFTLKELEIYKEENEALTRRLGIWKTATENSTKLLVKQEQGRFWENTLYFALGAVITGVLAVGVSRAVR